MYDQAFNISFTEKLGSIQCNAYSGAIRSWSKESVESFVVEKLV